MTIRKQHKNTPLMNLTIKSKILKKKKKKYSWKFEKVIGGILFVKTDRQDYQFVKTNITQSITLTFPCNLNNYKNQNNDDWLTCIFSR